MAATVAQIRAGIANRLKSHYSTGWNIQPYGLSNAVGPSMLVMNGETVFDRAMSGGYDQLFFTVHVLIPATNDQGMQSTLDVLRSPRDAGGVKAIIEGDKTLGGIVSWCVVRDVTKDAIYGATGGVESFGCEFRVEVAT